MYINTPYNYTGSKFKILDQILPFFDYSKDEFVDLFTGGGSVYTNVVDKYNKIIVNDIIEDLIMIHKELVNSDDIIVKTKDLCPNKADKIGYLELRKSYNECKSPEKLWALMLCCQNNMMRFNKSFVFNQTWGNRSWNPNTDKKITNFINHIRPYKNNIEFKSMHYRNIEIKENTFFYIDPPYLETEAGYNCYYDKKDDLNLYDFLNEINLRGSTYMISGVMGEHKNGKRSKLIDRLIDDGMNYKIIECDYEKVARNKNTKNSKEIIIFNYEL